MADLEVAAAPLAPSSAPVASPTEAGPSAPVAASLQGLPPAAPHTPAPAAEPWRALAGAFEREAAALGATASGARLLREAGRIHEAHLGDPRRALELYRRAVAAAPNDLGGVQAARRAAHALGEAELEGELLDAEAAAARSPRDAASLKLARARLLSDVVGRAPDAREALAAAAAADPESLAVAEEQAALAAAEQRFEDLSSALERCAALAGDPALAAAWLVHAAAVEEHRLGHPARAAELALRAFGLAPADAGVRAAARRHAERERNPDALAGVLAADAAAATSPRDAALAWCAVARLQEEQLNRPTDAQAALDRARQACGTDPVALDAVARVHEARGAWEAAAEVLRARAAAHVAGAAEEAAEVVEGNLRLAELCAERLGRSEEAAACYYAVLAVDPGHRGALSALGRIHAAAGDWARVLEVCMAERAAAGDPRDRAQRCFKAAEVLHERLGRVDDAVALYAEALALDPALVAAHDALERLYDHTGRHAQLAALLEADLEAVRDPDERVALLLRLARLQEDRLGDRAAAARAYERILAIAPRHVVAMRALAALLERAGRFADLVALLDRLAAVASEPRQTIALLQRKAEVQEEQLGDAIAAAESFERILALEPTHLPALRALGRLYGRAGRWNDLVAMSRAEAEVSPSTEAAANVLYRVGDILERRLGQEVEAIGAYREVLTLSPVHVGALRALARLYRARGEWENLVEALRADAAARTSPERKAALLSSVAEIWETRLSDVPHAIEVHEEALRLAPGFAPSIDALDRLLADAARWADLVELRRQQAGRLQGPARAAALVGAARVLLERLGDVAGAEAACRDALAAAPGDRGALVTLARFPSARAEARTALAGLVPDARRAAQLLVSAALDRVAAHAPAEADAALARAAALAPADPVAGPLAEPALEGAADAEAAAAYCLARREQEADAAARAAWTVRAAEARERAGDDARAVEAHRAALALDPDCLPALAGVARVQARLGAWKEAREALRAEAAALRDPALAAAAYAQAGEVAMGHLDDEEAAAEDWRAALARDPRDAAVAGALMALYRAAGRGGDACELQEARARVETAPEPAAAAWIAAGRMALEIGDRARALGSVARALEAVPTSLEALRLRGRLLVDEGRHAEAARDLGACLALASAPADVAAVHLDLAALYEGPLRDPARALSHLTAVLAAAPDDAGALARLARAHREAQNWPAAADVLRRLVALPDLPSDERRQHLLALATVREQGYDDVAGARELCERALELAPSDPAALDLLARLRERAGDHHGVVSALEAAAAAAPAGPERCRAHLRAARVLTSALNDPLRAIVQLKKALDADPSNVEARVALADLYVPVDPALAVDEHRRLLAADPARLESWRALYAVFRATKAHDRAFVAAGALRFLRASDPVADGFYYEENTRHLPESTTIALTPQDWAALSHPDDRGPLSELLALVGHSLAEAIHWPLERERTKVPQQAVALAAQLASNVGVEAFGLRTGIEGSDVRVDPWDPPFARVGAEVLRRAHVPEERFLLARAAARIRARSGVAARLGPEALGQLLAAVVQLVVPGYEGTGRPPVELIKAVGRTVPRKLRKALEEPARAVAAAGAVDVARWRASLAATADRVALLLCGDIPAALDTVLREGGAPTSAADVAAAARTRPELTQLLLFAASEEHLRLRQKLRLAIA